EGDGQSPPPPPPVWGGQWSSKQPGWQGGGLGGRPDGGPGPGGAPRFDPTDPAQRRARYSVLGGMWGLFFALLGWTSFSLLLGALGVYWGISALRMKPEQRAAARAAAAAALSRAPSAEPGQYGPGQPTPYGQGPLKPQAAA